MHHTELPLWKMLFLESKIAFRTKYSCRLKVASLKIPCAQNEFKTKTS